MKAAVYRGPGKLACEEVPDPVRHEKYQKRYELYREVYPLLADLNHRL